MLTEEKIIKNTIYYFGLFISISTMLIGAISLYNSYTFARSSIHAFGVVNRIERLSNTDVDVLSFEIKYYFNNNTYFVNNKNMTLYSIYKINEKIPLLINPDYPDKALINSYRELYEGYIFLFIIGFGVFIIIMTVRSIGR